MIFNLLFKIVMSKKGKKIPAQIQTQKTIQLINQKVNETFDGFFPTSIIRTTNKQKKQIELHGNDLLF